MYIVTNQEVLQIKVVFSRICQDMPKVLYNLYFKDLSCRNAFLFIVIISIIIISVIIIIIIIIIIMAFYLSLVKIHVNDKTN